MASVGVTAPAGFTRRQWAGVAASAAGVLCTGLAAWVAWLEVTGSTHLGWAVAALFAPVAALVLLGDRLLAPEGPKQ